MKKKLTIILLLIATITYAQKTKSNSNTRRFIEDADLTQINKDWNEIAEFKSGLGEVVQFFPVEAINLKTNDKLKALQMNMYVNSNAFGKTSTYSKSSWIDLDEISGFIYFIETYVIPNLDNKTERKQSVEYIFNSKEMVLNFSIQRNKRRISIFLKDLGITDHNVYFWTETQVNKIPRLLEMLKRIN